MRRFFLFCKWALHDRWIPWQFWHLASSFHYIKLLSLLDCFCCFILHCPIFTPLTDTPERILLHLHDWRLHYWIWNSHLAKKLLYIFELANTLKKMAMEFLVYTKLFNSFHLRTSKRLQIIHSNYYPSVLALKDFAVIQAVNKVDERNAISSIFAITVCDVTQEFMKLDSLILSW